MPLLGIFAKKSTPRSKTSGTASNVGHSVSNVTLDDEDYVSVSHPNSPKPSVSSSKLGLPLRRRPDRDQQQQQSYLDPLLEPPPRRSSLFQNYQDEPSVHRSTLSLPDSGQPQALPDQVSQSFPSPASVMNPAPKKSMFSWKSNRDRSKSAPSVKQLPHDSSFNLRSFRHIRPESPSSHLPASSAMPPIPTPTPTSAMPSPPISFQVTSRRPRDNSKPDLTVSLPQQTTASQQKIAAGAFRQAARRSTTSLSLTDSPVLSPVSPTRSSLDDRPPPSLLPPAQVKSSTPPRPPRSLPPQRTSPGPFRPPRSTPTPRTRTNAFAGSSSSSNEEEDEGENSDSTDDGSGLARKATIKPRVGGLPPVSAAVREHIQRATPPVDTAPPRAHSSLGVYGPGVRQRASVSLGALSPSAQEARASIAVVTDTRMTNSPRPPSKLVAASAGFTSAPAPAILAARRAVGSDTSESASDSDSDEDTPLSSLVPPRRPGTAMSSYSLSGQPRKTLVDLEAPSTLTGRPIGAPPPMAREENGRSKSRVSADFTSRASTQDSQTLKVSAASQSSRMLQTSSSSSQAQPAQGSRISQALLQPGPKVSSTQQSSRNSQVSSQKPTRSTKSHSLLSLEAPTMAPSSATRSNLSPSSVAPPMRPFARRESPASSTGDSSSGKAPLTPRDGSDLGGGTRSAYSGSANRSHQGHGRKPSVTFEDEQERGGNGKSRERSNANPQEARLRERRRTEARAAIELGNVVNGPPPVDEEDVALGHQGMQAVWATGMQIPVAAPIPPMFNMEMNMPIPTQGGFGYGTPPPGADAAYLVAHQQAMAIAKQTFQYAVAQQALAAANDEWERSSNVGAQWGGSQWGGGSGYGLGLGMGMRTSTMFPPAPRSMYAGSAGGGGGGGAQWAGTGSVYGETFGPARQSVYSQVDLSVPMNTQQRPSPRPRTNTAPSASAPPVGTGMGRTVAPPSSFRRFGH